MKGLKKYQKRCMASTIRKNQFFEELLRQPGGRLSGCELGFVRQWVRAVGSNGAIKAFLDDNAFLDENGQMSFSGVIAKYLPASTGSYTLPITSSTGAFAEAIAQGKDEAFSARMLCAEWPYKFE